MTQTSEPYTPPAGACPNCGHTWTNAELACPICSTLRYRRELEQISAQAMQTEVPNPQGAAALWAQCLNYLPSNSAQYQAILQRISLLSGGAYSSQPGHPLLPAEPPEARGPLSVAIAKTVGSMLLSIVLYLLIFRGSWTISTGFVLLILVHEMGHVVALRYYGLRASPPIFIPFLGAIINLKQRPPNALAEAVVGIGGPVAGALGALVCYAIFLHAPSQELLLVAYLGFFLNLWNLTPAPPLDGGRVTAAVSPWVWLLGLIILAGQLVLEYVQLHTINPILILILIYAVPHAWSTLMLGQRRGEYYRISRKASWTMGAIYALLAAGLWAMMSIAKMKLAAMHSDVF